MAVANIIKKIQDIMREDTGVDGDAQRLGQLTWMLFLKIYDDKERERESLDPQYKSAMPEDYRWRNWAEDSEGLTGDTLIEFINNKMFPALKQLKPDQNIDPRGFIIKEVFADAYNYIKSGTILRRVINQLNEIDFNRQEDRHLFNDIYETLLKSLQSASNAGEYYTPRPITEFVTEMTNPQLGDKVLDPACGTGGFLINALEYMRGKSVKTAEDENILQSNICGIEKKPLPHLLCTTNFVLHGVEVPQNIRRDNTLARPTRDYANKDRVDIILTNPPFGGTEEVGVKSNFPSAYQTSETADLFVYLIVHLLKIGGKAGIVLPDSFLSGDGVKARLKELIIQKCNLHTIIRLPQGVFNPYAGVRTSLLFFNKGQETKNIWFYEMPLPEGIKQYTKGKPITHAEFEPIKKWWGNRVENQYAWKVDAKSIKDKGFDLHLPNPSTKTVTIYNKDELLAEAQKLSKDISELVNKLNKALE